MLTSLIHRLHTQHFLSFSTHSHRLSLHLAAAASFSGGTHFFISNLSPKYLSLLDPPFAAVLGGSSPEPHCRLPQGIGRSMVGDLSLLHSTELLQSFTLPYPSQQHGCFVSFPMFHYIIITFTYVRISFFPLF